MEQEKTDRWVLWSMMLILVFYLGLGIAAAKGKEQPAAGTEAAEGAGQPAEAGKQTETGQPAERIRSGQQRETAQMAGGEQQAETGEKSWKADAQGARAGEPDDGEVAPRVALTFDDGPHPVYTPQLLDGLKERGISATFFVIGSNIPGCEEILKRMDEEGHLIGNHTYDHVKITNLSMEKACLQLTKTSELVRSAIGKDTEYIRPPFGEWDKSLECGIPMFPVLWSVDTLDWTTKNVDEIVTRGIRETHDGDIILMHDCYDSSVKAALQIADLLLEQGYEFVTADQFILE
ncbi:MAG: polysaccharide deacetylase family protein [Candidatus Limivivens sp.]|nr:polysaccharide deacetylase family protein [Candidatus Limivivens sp.]